MDRFDELSAFVAVAEHNGFAPAARALGLSPSAVTRLVAALEHRLGVLLFQRTTRAVHLTDAGRRLLERARRLLGDLDETLRIAESERIEPVGRLALTAPVMFGRLHVMPLIARYMQLHTNVQVDLMLADRLVNMVEEGMDAAVRIGALPASADVARRIGLARRVVAASPDYLARHGSPRHPSDLASHGLIAFSGQSAPDHWRFWRDGKPIDVRVAARLTVNDAAAAVWSAVEGCGLVMALSYQVAAEVQAGRLRIVLTAYEPAPMPIQIVFPSSRLLSAKVRALVDLAVDTCDWSFDHLDRRNGRSKR